MTVFFLGFISLFCCQGYYFDNKGTLLPEITKSALIPGGLEFLILFRHPKLFILRHKIAFMPVPVFSFYLTHLDSGMCAVKWPFCAPHLKCFI